METVIDQSQEGCRKRTEFLR